MYVKMAVGLNINTPNYIWRMKAGNGGIETGMLERAANYLVEIMKTKEERSSKKIPTGGSSRIIEWKPNKMGKRNEKGHGRNKGGRNMSNYEKRERKRAYC